MLTRKIGQRWSAVGRCVRRLGVVGLLGFSFATVALWSARGAQNANPAEANAFNTAARAFNATDYDLARRQFADFIRAYPQSARVAEAVFFEAQASLELGDARGAISLLDSNLPSAGGFTEQYLYLLGTSHFQASNYLDAGKLFARFATNFPNSQLVLEATYREALAWFRLNDADRVVKLLQSPDGTFQKLAPNRTNDDVIASSQLLLSEALMRQNQLAAAERTLLAIHPKRSSPELMWKQEYLLCQLQMQQQRLPEALIESTNLVSIAASNSLVFRRAESIQLQGELFEQSANISAAASVYEQNLAKDLSQAVRKQALLKIVNLSLTKENPEQGAARIERLLVEHPGEEGIDVARLGLGELRLKQYFNAPTNSPPTNLLSAALFHFEEVTRLTNSEWTGKAQLDRGWCLWEAGKTNESASAFKAAAEQLPHSTDQAVARFKLGDALMARSDFSNAVDNFQVVLKSYSDLEPVRRSLFPHAWYNLLRCAIEIDDLDRANASIEQILRNYSDTLFAEKGMFLLGQELSRNHRPVDARALFRDFVERFRQSPLLPEVELALARSYEQEQQWTNAIAGYDQWIARYSTNESRARAEFDRALANYHALRETNAANLFTNFLARFPNDKLTPLARTWIADFYFRQRDFASAEANYQLILQSSAAAGTELGWQARIMAGRAAYGRQDYRAATNYFLQLVNNNACPPHVAAEAWQALGDTIIEQDNAPGKAALKTYDEAKDAFRRIVDLYPTNSMVPSAWGRIGDCFLQMASFDPKFYENAITAYQTAIGHPAADIRVRSLAEFGLGRALELQARAVPGVDSEAAQRNALDHYQVILLGKNLNAAAGEKVDLYCYRLAALQAASIAEERKQWQLAVNIYKELIQVVPAVKASVERKMQRALEQLSF